MKEIFLEVRTEEIPSGYIPGAMGSLEKETSKFLGKNRISFESIKTYATCRRLILQVEGVAEKQENISKKIVGPPTKIAYDSDGKPTRAAMGFAEKQGTTVDKLSTEKTEKGEYLAYVHKEKGVRTKKLLPTLLPEIIGALIFPKYMRWGAGSYRFVRPIHSIAALFGGEVVRFKIGDIQSGNSSVGHRFMAPQKITFKDAKSFIRSATAKCVVVESSERKEIIEKAANKLSTRIKGQVRADPQLLDTLVNMTEFPIPVLGSFEKEYLKLPQELLIAVMKKHQKYLSVVDAKGKLMPNFIAVSDNRVNNTKLVRTGFERVLRARLSDAHHFYAEDTKRPFEEYVERLKTIVWLEKLGTVFDKKERIKKLSTYIASKVAPEEVEIVGRASELCKADLVTLMVYEFPELQGIIGREYAKKSNEPKEVARAIEEHYLPVFSGDKLPSKDASAIVSIADKMDTLVGCFAAGLIPSGSEDPHALRRQSLGLMNILIKKGWDVSIMALLQHALSLFPQEIREGKDRMLLDIKTFLQGRLKNQLITDGNQYDAVDSVFSVSFDMLAEDVRKVQALSKLKKESYFDSLTIAFKRVCNIMGEKEFPAPDESLFTEEAEKSLHRKLKIVQKESTGFIAQMNFNRALQSIADIKGEVDIFFDSVMVMDKDEKIKNNRLGLLGEVSSLFKELADFSKIVVD